MNQYGAAFYLISPVLFGIVDYFYLEPLNLIENDLRQAVPGSKTADENL